MNEFVSQVIPEPEYAGEFKKFKKQYDIDYGIEDYQDFEISKQQVKNMKKQVKNVINLDTNITIRLNSDINATADEYLEKGYDKEKEMFYYKVYFNNEI